MSDWTPDRGATDRDRALRAAIERELPSLLALARRLTGEGHDAQDALQDALERAWRARAQLRDPEAAGGWLRSILARRVVDSQRRRRDLPIGAPDELEDLIPDVDDPAAVLASAGQELRLRAALRAIPPADRVAVVLHEGEGWPAAEIAKLLGVGTEAGYKRIQRARARLVAAFAEPLSPVSPPDGACRDARAHAHGLLDGTLDETTRAEVRAHLDTCPACPAALQAAAGVLAELRLDAEATAVPGPLRARLDELVREADAAR